MATRLKRYLTGFLLAAALAALCPMPLHAKSWEPVKAERADAKTVLLETDIEIRAANGVLMVNTNHPVQIKVYTILGRLVNTDTLPAGRSQLTLPAHGVYIVKIGDLTCKVAV